MPFDALLNQRGVRGEAKPHTFQVITDDLVDKNVTYRA